VCVLRWPCFKHRRPLKPTNTKTKHELTTRILFALLEVCILFLFLLSLSLPFSFSFSLSFLYFLSPLNFSQFLLFPSSLSVYLSSYFLSLSLLFPEWPKGEIPYKWAPVLKGFDFD
jgi:hypothetical protein